MIAVGTIGEVKKFRLARSFLERAVYYTAAYLVDGLLVDTGCAYTVKELVSAVEGLDLDFVVNTHSHEGHIGANAASSENRSALIFDHPTAVPPLGLPRRKSHLNPYQLHLSRILMEGCQVCTPGTRRPHVFPCTSGRPVKKRTSSRWSMSMLGRMPWKPASLLKALSWISQYP
jgi:hypothetical protein